MPSAAPPTAGTITVSETIALLDGSFGSVVRGIAENRYVLWLGWAFPVVELMAWKASSGTAAANFLRQQPRDEGVLSGALSMCDLIFSVPHHPLGRFSRRAGT